MAYHWELTEFGKTKISEKTFSEHMSQFKQEDHPDCSFVLPGMGIGHFLKDGKNIYLCEKYCRSPEDKIVAIRSVVRRLVDMEDLIGELEEAYIRKEPVVLISYNGGKITIDPSAIPEMRLLVSERQKVAGQR